jgi:DNA-binding NtrC family response regulator
VVMAGKLEQTWVEADDVADPLEHGGLQVVVENGARYAIERDEGGVVAAQKALERLVENEAGEERPRERQHHHEARQPPARVADGDGPEAAPVDLPLLAGELLGTTPEMLSLFATLDRFAPSSLSIVIHGETGTGKERVARAIHDASPRRSKPFLAINCAAVPDALLEDELFGHARGAFTGADRERKGLLVEADGGTIFFDEVAEMSPAMQAKLLRVLENGEVRAMGTERPRKVDVRTLFATHADLGEAVNKRRFREDLYFRIAQVTIEIPPLRRRPEDMPLLIQDILEELGRPEVSIDGPSMAILLGRSCPGNVRELRSFLKVALVGSTGGVLELHDTGRGGAGLEPMAFEAMTYDEAKKEFRRRYYTGLYAACRGNLTQMAKRAGKQRFTVREALRELWLKDSADPDPSSDRASATGEETRLHHSNGGTRGGRAG